MIFDCIFCPAWNFLCDFSPSAGTGMSVKRIIATIILSAVTTICEKGAALWFYLEGIPVSHTFVCYHKHLLLRMGPCIPPDIRAQLIMPSFPALLANSSREPSCDLAPATFPKLMH